MEGLQGDANCGDDVLGTPTGRGNTVLSSSTPERGRTGLSAMTLSIREPAMDAGDTVGLDKPQCDDVKARLDKPQRNVELDKLQDMKMALYFKAPVVGSVPASPQFCAC